MREWEKFQSLVAHIVLILSVSMGFVQTYLSLKQWYSPSARLLLFSVTCKIYVGIFRDDLLVTLVDGVVGATTKSSSS